ncbi:MAG: hypothetical protein JJU13_11485 [Balneolaceae bacterium]|nr:hypothetical protein [Balneolaceae bacterium]
MTEIELYEAISPEQVLEARMLFIEYAGKIGTDLKYQGFSNELKALPKPYTAPYGTLLLARIDENLAG